MWDGFFFLWKILTWRGIGIIIFGWLIFGRVLCRVWPDWMRFRRKAIWQHIGNCFQKAKELLQIYPQKNPSFRHLFSLVLWPLLVFLNLFILGQVLEVFFGVGGRVDLPLFGAYYVFALVMAFIYVGAQVWFGLALEQAHSTQLRQRWLWGIALGIAIIGEGVLAGYRGWLLTAGEIVLSPTTMDQVIMRSGVAVAAFIGLLIPIAEVGSGMEGINGYLEPMAPVFFSRLKAILLWLWCALLWWIFPPLPPWEREILNKNSDRREE